MSQKNKSKNKTSKSRIQSVIFSSNWKSKDARKWLKKNNLSPIGRVKKTKKKPRSDSRLDASSSTDSSKTSKSSSKTDGSVLTYTIALKENFSKTGFKKIPSRGISLIIGFQ